jgi:predicted outer membrane repeat protein
VVRDGHARRVTGDDGDGGAIRGGALLLHSKSRLVSNVADGNGGAFATELVPATSLSGLMSNVLLKGNSAAANGGAVYVEGSPRGNLPMSGVRLVHNSAGGSGGAVFGSGPVLNHSTIADNRSGGNGGGIAFNGSGGGVLWSTVSGNRAGGSGGGIETTGSASGGQVGLYLADSTIANNRAGADGGGIGTSGGESTALVSGDTIARNGAGLGHRGGGLYQSVGDSISVQNTILALNLAGAGGPDCFGESSGLASMGHNLLGDPQGCLGFGATDLFGGRFALGKLADNGGEGHGAYGRPLQTIALGRDSRAIDHALHISAFDERGVVRGDRQDIGAYERVTRSYRFGSSRHQIRCTPSDRICAKS